MSTILFIDDQQQPLFYHETYLRDEGGYIIEFFRYAEKAMEYVEKLTPDSTPDLFILDINMPADGRYSNDPTNSDGSKTGIRLLKDICENLQQRTPPIIVLTQIQNSDILREARYTYPAIVLLDKFATGPTMLLETVRHLLSDDMNA